MPAFTLTEFRQVVEKCFQGEAGPLDETAWDASFSDLGFDSLMVYEITVRIQDEYPVEITDEELDELKTPGAFVAFVDSRLSVSG
ncbi:acyl carrier protein [Streptomyces sp. NPDC007164]|uniref:acyl carrier protein n=1 Tax=unclassified Streptomyces TaxID=2593676 RepID=UPI0033F9824B